MNSVIKNLFRSLLLLCAFSFSAFAAQIAVISVPKAIVYSDQNLTTPLGYIAYGKKIRVGEVERKDGTVLPLVISGRIAYIQTKDIIVKSLNVEEGFKNPKITEHDVALTFQTDQDKLSENNFVSFSLGSYSAGNDWKNLSDQFNDDTANFKVISVHMEHRNPIKRISWGFGLSYLSVSQSQLAAKTITIDGNLYYALFHFRYLTLEGFGGLSFSGDFQLDQGQGNQKTKGVGIGYTFGGIARILPYSKLGFFAGAALKSLKLKDLEPIEDSSENDVYLNSLSGVNIFAGISYKF